MLKILIRAPYKDTNNSSVLFILQNLGLKGNQLSLEISSIYNEPNGMRKLLDYMLDNMSGKRKRITLIFLQN